MNAIRIFCHFYLSYQCAINFKEKSILTVSHFFFPLSIPTTPILASTKNFHWFIPMISLHAFFWHCFMFFSVCSSWDGLVTEGKTNVRHVQARFIRICDCYRIKKRSIKENRPAVSCLYKLLLWSPLHFLFIFFYEWTTNVWPHLLTNINSLKL